MVMTLLCALHCRVVPYRRSPQTAATHVRRRLASLPKHASQGRGQGSRPSLHLCYRHQRLDAGNPIIRLRLNQTKTQVMWLGSSQQLDKIAIKEVPLLSSHVTVIDTARDLDC